MKFIIMGIICLVFSIAIFIVVYLELEDVFLALGLQCGLFSVGMGFACYGVAIQARRASDNTLEMLQNVKFELLDGFDSINKQLESMQKESDNET